MKPSKAEIIVETALWTALFLFILGTFFAMGYDKGLSDRVTTVGAPSSHCITCHIERGVIK